MQLIPEELLQKSDKVLFIAHLAIGDFTYLQTYFQAFAKKYPHIKIDLWVDEVRRTRCFWKWNSLKKYSLYDWLDACPFFNKIYRETYSYSKLNASIESAKKENYPIVISISTLRANEYAKLAREICKTGFVFGISKKTTIFQQIKKRSYKKLDATILYESPFADESVKHITDVYAKWFNKICGLEVARQDRAPFVNIPQKWKSYAQLRFLKWGLYKRQKGFKKVFFINPFAKDTKRCWPIPKISELLLNLKQNDEWNDVTFILNVTPDEYKRVNRYFQKHPVNNLIIFSANINFFQLPAIISLCDLVISVETAVIHLASALNIPTLALMRQKNPEWGPWRQENCALVLCKNRRDWIKKIEVADVIAAAKDYCSKIFNAVIKNDGI
jgi:ADP-heptose:LPS heptosyltransferase